MQAHKFLRSNFFLFGLCFLKAFFTSAHDGLTARFSFNNHSFSDEVNGSAARLSGCAFVEDRFGNKNSAVFLSGNRSSYVNLGTSKALKPDSGTVSIWVNIEAPAWSGQGHRINPILLTKSVTDNNFYEAYAIYYMLSSGRIVAIFSKDSLTEVAHFGKAISKNSWHHLAITYDHRYGSLYIDGELELKLPKNFDTKFLPSDSVMLGSTANKKNSRYFAGAIDDVEFYNRVLTAKEIQGLYHAKDPNYKSKLIWLWSWRLGLVAAVFFILYFLIRSRVRKEIAKRQQKLELTNQWLETELRVNRALMNPHFVFNAMNSLQNFILDKDYLQANNYLVKFSKLLRRLLEANLSNVVNLELEIELIECYLEIETLRFEGSIQYSISVDPTLRASALHIPVMMLQPFIENAIWHGLLKKQGEKRLQIAFAPVDEHYLECVIKDNGIGRANAARNKPANKSLATVFIQHRLEFLNKIHQLNCRLVIEDMPEGQGTTVILLLPILKK